MKAPKELKLITAEQFGIDIEMAYATSNNFTGHPIYKGHDCYLHPLAAQGVKRASELLRPLNLKLKVWDAFRPITAQAELFQFFPDPDYVSDPDSGLCSHCRGIAIDLTIIDHFGHELEMGTPFDDFRPLAHHGNEQISAEAQRNRLVLAGVMNLAGFDPLDTEWWHYQLPEAISYPIIKPEQKPSSLT